MSSIKPSFSLCPHPMPLFNQTIRRKIVGIALGLIVLTVVTSILSMAMSSKVGLLLDELTDRYIPAYGHLARAPPGDGSARTLLARIAQFEASPPAADWDGAWRMDGK